MASTPNSNLSEEQLFLATLQECLQADNDKRAAGEVRSHLLRLSSTQNFR